MMIIRMKGKPEELAVFMKAMQLPVMGSSGEQEEATETEAKRDDDARQEVETEIEKIFSEMSEAESATLYTNLTGRDAFALMKEAKRVGMGVSELIANIICEYIDYGEKGVK